MKRIAFIGVLGVTTLLAGCGLSTPVKMPAVNTYTITSMKAPLNPRRTRARSTLLVTTPVASPGYGSNSMIYVEVPFKLRAYAQNAWVAPPAHMILPLLAQRIRNKGYFHAVVSQPFSGLTTYRLDTNLLVLQQEFLRPVSRVHVVMQATLVNNRTDRVIASRRFQTYVNAPENNPYSGVLATNRAVSIMDSRIAQFVVRSV